MEQDDIYHLLKEHSRGISYLRDKLKAMAGDDARWAEHAVDDAIDSLESAVHHLEG